MEWRNPSLLLASIPVLIAWIAIVVFSSARNRRRRDRFADNAMMERLAPAHTFSIRRGIATVLQGLGIAASMLALAGPKFGETSQTVFSKGSDLYVLLDVSRSMLATDVTPSRLARAKADIASLSNQLRGERIGLIAFAGQAIVQCPLTVDYENFRKSLANVDTLSAPKGGTSIGNAVRKAMEIFVRDTGRNRAILLVTDGGDQESDPMDAAKIAADSGVPLYIVGLGDMTQGARIPSTTNQQSYVEYAGEQVWSKLDGALLEKLASVTNGSYLPAGTQSFDLSTLYNKLLSTQQISDSEDTTIVVKADQFQWFLGVGLTAFLASLLLRSISSMSQAVPTTLAMARSASSLSVALLAIAITAPRVMADSPARLINDGVHLFEQQDFEQAREAFTYAQSLAKGSSAIRSLAAFDQACTEHQLREWTKAIELYQLASQSPESKLAALAQFNLGRLYSDLLLDDGTEVPSSKETTVDRSKERAELESNATRGIEAFQNALELDPRMEDARKNLEILKQWLSEQKQIWELEEFEQNSAKQQSLELLDAIYEAQRTHHNEMRSLDDFRQLKAYQHLSKAELKLRKQLPVLQSKIQSELQQASGQVEDQKSQAQAASLLGNGIRKIDSSLELTTSKLRDFQASHAQVPSAEALDNLDQLWNALGPYDATAIKALRSQTELASQIQASKDSTINRDDWERESTQNARRTKSLVMKATMMRGELSSAEQPSKASTPQQSDDAELPVPTEVEAEPAPQALQESLDKCIELGPKAMEAIDASLDAFEKGDLGQSAIQAEEARKILEEIVKSLPPPPQQNNPSDQKQNQDQKSDESKQDNSEKSQSEPKQSQDSSSQEKNQQDQNQKEQSSEGQSQDDQKKPKDSSESQGDPSENATSNENQSDSQKESDLAKEEEEEGDKEKQGEAASQKEQQTEEEKKQEQASNSKESDQEKEGKREGAEAKNEQRDEQEQSMTNDMDKGTTDEKPAISQDRLDELVRKVREREAQKRLRDKRLQQRSYGRPRVEKDW